jgi:hypothetical protein
VPAELGQREPARRSKTCSVGAVLRHLEGTVEVLQRPLGLPGLGQRLAATQGLDPDAPKRPCVVGYQAAGVVDALGSGAEATR